MKRKTVAQKNLEAMVFDSTHQIVLDSKPKHSTTKKKHFIGGTQISRKEAMKGLGHPKTWKADKAKLMKEFKRKPSPRKDKGEPLETL